jgi:ankyrin repeat protein
VAAAAEATQSHPQASLVPHNDSNAPQGRERPCHTLRIVTQEPIKLETDNEFDNDNIIRRLVDRNTSVAEAAIQGDDDSPPWNHQQAGR